MGQVQSFLQSLENRPSTSRRGSLDAANAPAPKPSGVPPTAPPLWRGLTQQASGSTDVSAGSNRSPDDDGAFVSSRPATGSITYVTDVEGNFEYFMRFVELSRGLRLVGVHDDGALDVELLDGWQFVFGGDSVDKGGAIGGSVRVVRTLLRMKRKYPTRVTLILGRIPITYRVPITMLARARGGRCL